MDEYLDPEPTPSTSLTAGVWGSGEPGQVADRFPEFSRLAHELPRFGSLLTDLCTELDRAASPLERATRDAEAERDREEARFFEASKLLAEVKASLREQPDVEQSAATASFARLIAGAEATGMLRIGGKGAPEGAQLRRRGGREKSGILGGKNPSLTTLDLNALSESSTRFLGVREADVAAVTQEARKKLAESSRVVLPLVEDRLAKSFARAKEAVESLGAEAESPVARGGEEKGSRKSCGQGEAAETVVQSRQRCEALEEETFNLEKRALARFLQLQHVQRSCTRRTRGLLNRHRDGQYDVARVETKCARDSAERLAVKLDLTYYEAQWRAYNHQGKIVALKEIRRRVDTKCRSLAAEVERLRAEAEQYRSLDMGFGDLVREYANVVQKIRTLEHHLSQFEA